MDISNISDQQIVQSILARDTFITKEFLYKKCYPLFKAAYNRYYTDCESCIELINEIYAYIMYPHKETHVCKLAGFGFRCSLTMWIKVITENYCRQLYARKITVVTNSDIGDDRYLYDTDSMLAYTHNLDMDDIYKILNMMPNQRYRKLIECRYLDEKSNEDTALLLGLSMANYYNSHKRAKDQFCMVLKIEGII